jgi:hypothetical protein
MPRLVVQRKSNQQRTTLNPTTSIVAEDRLKVCAAEETRFFEIAKTVPEVFADLPAEMKNGSTTTRYKNVIESPERWNSTGPAYEPRRVCLK